MKALLPILCLASAISELSAQITLPYEVDFTFGIPSSWTQTAGNTVLWEYESFGKEGPGCAIADRSEFSDRLTGRIETPPLHFTWLSDPVLRFNAAFIKNNFVAPAISLWYDKGDGWTLLDSWGEWSLADGSMVNHQLEGGDDYEPPLDAENILWHSITVDLTFLAGEQNVRFGFQAEFPNGGWVLLDDVRFLQTVAGVEREYAANDLRAIPNPAVSTLSIESGAAFDRVEVFDALGRNVLTAESESGSGAIRLDVSELPAGAYWLQLIDGNGWICGMERFVKE